jgi:Flp pilus assembly protein TadG
VRRLRRRGERGQGLVEFALVLPVLLLIMLGLFDFGRAIYAFNTVSNAAREGARVAIVNQGQAGGVYVAATEAARQATALGLDASDPAQVQVAFPDALGTCVGCRAQVTVTYQFSPITPVIGTLIGQIPLASTTEIPIERSYAP